MRYVLFEIERQVSGRAFDYTSDRYNIEHVLPEHPGDGWNHFTDEQMDRHIFRIGNMTPLAAGPNRDMGNRSFDDKRSVFEQCEFEIMRRIASESET